MVNFTRRILSGDNYHIKNRQDRRKVLEIEGSNMVVQGLLKKIVSFLFMLESERENTPPALVLTALTRIKDEKRRVRSQRSRQ